MEPLFGWYQTVRYAPLEILTPKLLKALPPIEYWLNEPFPESAKDGLRALADWSRRLQRKPDQLLIKKVAYQSLHCLFGRTIKVFDRTRGLFSRFSDKKLRNDIRLTLLAIPALTRNLEEFETYLKFCGEPCDSAPLVERGRIERYRVAISSLRSATPYLHRIIRDLKMPPADVTKARGNPGKLERNACIDQLAKLFPLKKRVSNITEVIGCFDPQIDPRQVRRRLEKRDTIPKNRK
jgi:hypothetical protein